jgi:hypothetical protein
MKVRQWNKILSRLLKSELTKRGLSYEDLNKKLAAIGVNEKTVNINNKIGRGTFSAIFFVQCLRAMEVKTIRLDDAFFECEEKI